MRSTSVLRGFDPGLHRVVAGLPARQHRGSEPARGVADQVERAVERQPVEIIGHDDLARGMTMRSSRK